MKKIYNLYNGQSLEDIDIINDLRKPPKFRRRLIKNSKGKTDDTSKNDNDLSEKSVKTIEKKKPGRKPKVKVENDQVELDDDNQSTVNNDNKKKRKYTKRKEDEKGKLKKSTSQSKKTTTTVIEDSKKNLIGQSMEELDLAEKIDLLPNSLINLLKNGKYAIVKYHGSTECVGIQKCDTMLGKKELKKIKELKFKSDELETSKALRIKFENDSKKSQHRFLIITPAVWKHWNWFHLHNAEIDYTRQQ